MMSLLEQQFCNTSIEEDYPLPIVDIKKIAKHAGDILWNLKGNSLVKKESYRILRRYTLADSINTNYNFD